MLKAYQALRIVEGIVAEVFKGILKARRLNDEQLIVEILESKKGRKD